MPILQTELLSAAWLFLLLLVAVAYAVRLLRRSDYDWWESCLYLPTYLLGRLLWRVHFTNSPPPALSGGAVLVANHRSSVDPFFVQLAARRRVHWMVAKEYCQHAVFGPLLRALQVIPTNRSGMDTAATKTALRITQAGRLVGMFPEGKINKTDVPLLPLHSGAALVALKSQVPLVPLLIEGSPSSPAVWSPLFKPACVRITFGTPIWPNGCKGQRQSETTGTSGSEGSDQACHALPGSAPASSPLASASAGENLQSPDDLTLIVGQRILASSRHPNFPIKLISRRRQRR